MPYIKKRRKELEGNRLHVPDVQNADRYDWYVEVPISILVLFSPLAIGSVHLWSVGVVWILAVLAFTALVVRRIRRKSALRLFPMGALLLLVSTLTLIQLIPLPPFLIRLINPSAAGLFDFLLSGTGLWGEGNWRPISLQPPATALELIKWTSYSLVFLVVVNKYTKRHRARRLLKSVAWSGFLVALVGFFSKLLMAKAIYGVYGFDGETQFFSTFVNANHLAGFLGLCAPLAAGIALSSRQRQEKALYGFMSVIIGAALFVSLSRGGIVAFCIGCSFMFVFAMTRRFNKKNNVVMVQVMAAGALLVAGYLFYDTILKELQTLGEENAIQESAKMRAWEGTLPMMLDYPVMGIGRGAFSSVYPTYKSVQLQGTFSHPENQVLQYMVEWGPIWGALVLGVFIWCYILALKRSRQSFVMGGCLAGVFALAAHNLVDFNLEIVGVALPFTVVLGILAVGPFSSAGSPTKLESRFRLSHKAYFVLTALVIAIGILCFPYIVSHRIEEATQALVGNSKTAPSEPCSDTPLGMAACEIMRHHPADYMAPLVLGKAYLDADPPDLQRSVYWLNRAQYLNPTMSLIHWLSGRALYMGGFHGQALLEYRVGISLNSKNLPSIIDEVMRLAADPEAAIKATPENAEDYMKLARILGEKKMNQAAIKAAKLALKIDSTMIPAMDLLGNLAWSQGRFEEALGLARQTIEIDPLHYNGYYQAGMVYYSQKKQDQAEKIWLDGLTHVPDSTQLASRIVGLYLTQNRITDAEKVADNLRSFSPSDDYSQSRLNILEGNIEIAKGRLFEARKHYRQASILFPSNKHYLRKVANTEERMGNWIEAERIYEQLLVSGYQENEMRKRLKTVSKAREEEKNRAMWDTWVKPGREKEKS